MRTIIVALAVLAACKPATDDSPAKSKVETTGGCAFVPWPDSVFEVLSTFAAQAEQVACLAKTKIDAATQKANAAKQLEYEREARIVKRGLYAEKLERDMANDGISAIVRVEGTGNSTLYLKLSVCRDIDLNAIVNSDGFADVQRDLRFDRVRCEDTLGNGAVVKYDWSKEP